MVKLDPHSGCLLPVTSIEIRESMLILGWGEDEVRVIIDYTEAMPDGTPAGYLIEITGPASKPPFDPSAFEFDGTQLSGEAAAGVIAAVVSGGYGLPPCGPIISFGWKSRASAAEALRAAFSKAGAA